MCFNTARTYSTIVQNEYAVIAFSFCTVMLCYDVTRRRRCQRGIPVCRWRTTWGYVEHRFDFRTGVIANSATHLHNRCFLFAFLLPVRHTLHWSGWAEHQSRFIIPTEPETSVKRQRAVIVGLTSKQLLLFAFACEHCTETVHEFTQNVPSWRSLLNLNIVNCTSLPRCWYDSMTK